jgi:3-hydroxyisobutyrate dehydrogenase
MNSTVGWVGVGKMGEAMVERLLDAGVAVDIWNRTPEKAAALVERGATLVASPAEAASHAIVFSMMLDDKALLDMANRADGILAGGASIWVDCSSVSPGVATEVAQTAEARGVKFVNAPVSGNPGVVRAGNLIFAASGPADAIELARPYFQAIGRSVHNVGEAQQAAVVKICTNAVLSVVLDSLAEVLVLGEKSGVKRGDLLRFINDSAIGSPFTTYKTGALVNLDMTPTFSPEAQRKDLRLALSLAEEVGSTMPIIRQTETEVNRLVESGVGEGKDFAAMLLQVAADSSLTLGTEG